MSLPNFWSLCREPANRWWCNPNRWQSPWKKAQDCNARLYTVYANAIALHVPSTHATNGVWQPHRNDPLLHATYIGTCECGCEGGLHKLHFISIDPDYTEWMSAQNNSWVYVIDVVARPPTSWSNTLFWYAWQIVGKEQQTRARVAFKERWGKAGRMAVLCHHRCEDGGHHWNPMRFFVNCNVLYHEYMVWIGVYRNI